MSERQAMVKEDHPTLSKRRRAKLLKVNLSSLYVVKKPISLDNVTLMNEIRDIYARHPFMGYRRVTVLLNQAGFKVNRKRVWRLMKLMGIQAIYPKMNLSKRRQKDAVFPYLLKKDPPQKPHDCWSVDITYIKIGTGWVYLTALIDVISRHVMGWSLSPQLDTENCLKAFEMALQHGIRPKIVNSDQGCQFTSEMWVWAMVKHRIEISMDGKGRCMDNIYIERFWRTIKYEEIYLKTYDSVKEAKMEINDYIHWYNQQRPHQSLNYKTPYVVMSGRDRPDGFVDNSLDNNSSSYYLHELSTSSTGPTTTEFFI